MDEWNNNWIGYANHKSFHTSAQTSTLEGLSIGTSSGAVRFKVYDKDLESKQRGSSRFWRSVWGVGENDLIDVARFEWSIKCYKANFSTIRYLPDLTFDNMFEMLNYASLRWGRLCIPQSDESNQSRWPLAPVWQDLRGLIDAWYSNFDRVARRQYDFRPDISAIYLRSLVGWLAGFQVRLGLEQRKDNPASFMEILEYLQTEGFSIEEIAVKAAKKWPVLAVLAGRERIQ
jgi:hypothetical protein